MKPDEAPQSTTPRTLERPVRLIVRPVRVGFKYASLKDATDRIIAKAPKVVLSDERWEQWLSDVETIVEALNREA